MLRTNHNSAPELFRSTLRLATVFFLAFFAVTIASRSAYSADNVGQNNYGGRKVLSRVEPMYPADLRAANIGGYVHLNITISPSGTVANISIVGGNPILAQAAVHAVTSWKFAPASSSTAAEVWFHFAP